MTPPVKDLEQVAALNEEQLVKIAKALRDELPCTRAHLNRSIEPLGISAKAVTRVIGHYLSRAAPGGPFHGRTWEALRDDLRAAVGSDALKRISEKEEILRDILSESNAVAFKGALLQQRALPHVAEFSTLVDLRPVFDEKHTSVLAYVPAVIVQLSLHSEGCERAEAEQFQLTPDGLDSMITTLKDAQTKLSVMLKSARDSRLKVLE